MSRRATARSAANVPTPSAACWRPSKSSSIAARAMRLAHDRWALRRPDFRAYGNQMTTPLARFARLKTRSTTSSRSSAPRRSRSRPSSAARRRRPKRFPTIVPPEEFRAAHALFLSAAHLADTAAKIRMEAALTGDLRAGVGRIFSRRGRADAGGAGAQRFSNLFTGTPTAAVITPRRTRLIRVPDLHAFRARHRRSSPTGPGTIVVVPNRAAARQLARGFTRSHCRSLPWC